MAWLPKKTVVVPIDFSGKSVESVSTALDLVDEPAGVHVIHVVVPLDNMSPGMSWGAIDDQSRVEAVRAHFDEFLKEHDVSGVTPVIRVGDPGMEIAEYANTAGAELVVISSHGYHGIKRMLLGSVAERVVRHAECEVLITRRVDAE